MFAKKFRLPSSIKFPPKPFFVNNYFVVKVKDNNVGFNRYAFIVSKKIDKRATVRNRVKRVIRACFEKMDLEISKSKDILVIAKGESVDKTNEEIQNSLEDFKKKIL